MSLFAYLSFSISALPPGGVFPLWLHFSHLWTLGQKSIIQIFDTSWLDKNIRQIVKNECFWASCISGTLNPVNTVWGLTLMTSWSSKVRVKGQGHLVEADGWLSHWAGIVLHKNCSGWNWKLGNRWKSASGKKCLLGHSIFCLFPTM